MPIARTLRLLTLGLLLSAATFGAASAAAPAKLVIPKPTVPTGQAYSPHAIVAKLAQSRFKVLELYRKGQAYAIVAIGPTGNKVQMTVDGASGTIVGMAIIRRAHSAARPAAHRPPAGHAPPPAHTPPAHTPPPTHTAANPPPHPPARPAPGHIPPPPPRPRFADDTKPFGAVIPLAAFRHWTAYKETEWRAPAPATIPVTYTYAPYREAMPYSYYVALPNQDAFAVAPPNYTPYDVYDPYGTALNNALNDADDAEYRAMMAEADANYLAASNAALNNENNALHDENNALNNENNDLADENAALRDQLDAINNAPPPPVESPDADFSLAPAAGENLDTIADVPPPGEDGLGGGAMGPDTAGDDTIAPTNEGGGADNPGDDNNAVAPENDNSGGDNTVAPENSGDTGGDNTVAPENNGDNGGDNTVAPENSGDNGGDNTVAPENNGDNGGDNTVAPENDNSGGDNNDTVAPENNGDNGGDNNADNSGDSGGDNGADNGGDNGGDNSGDNGGDDNSGDGN